MLKILKPITGFVEDPRREFMAVVCTAMKPNGHFCSTPLGEIETSRPNVAKHWCRACKITYRHEVDENGVVTCKAIRGSALSTRPQVKVAA